MLLHLISIKKKDFIDNAVYNIYYVCVYIFIHIHIHNFSSTLCAIKNIFCFPFLTLLYTLNKSPARSGPQSAK